MVTKAAPAAPAAANTAQTPRPKIDQDALDIKALAAGVLARDFRPRAASVRRLAEAVLAKPKKKKKPGSTKAAGKKTGGKSARKLAKIPGQKGKKKS